MIDSPLSRTSPATVLYLLALLAFAATAEAHFILNLNVRVLHVQHVKDGLLVYLRTPMPYLVADRVGPERKEGLPDPAPYTSNAMENGNLVHYVDFDRLQSNPLGLGSFAEQGFEFRFGGARLQGTVERMHVYRVGTQPDFASLEEAEKSFDIGAPLPDRSVPLYVGDAVIDMVIRYGLDGPVRDYSISSTLNPGLPGQENTANLILDYGSGGVEVYRARGLLNSPVAITRSGFRAVYSFVKEGIRHILEGLDHVLFVLCLVLGAVQLRSLVWRVTGFTIGHSITLTVGFFGFVPSGAWFVPTVETGIALSIIYAAVVAVLPSSRLAGSERSMFMVTCFIGLLHGLGFSFVLHKILQVTSPDIWQSLLAFNVGVEIGQLAIVMLTWPLLHALGRFSEGAWRVSRFAMAAACIVVAGVWTVERSISVMQTL